MYLVITIVIFVILVRTLPVALNDFDTKRVGDKDGVEDAILFNSLFGINWGNICALYL